MTAQAFAVGDRVEVVGTLNYEGLEGKVIWTGSEGCQVQLPNGRVHFANANLRHAPDAQPAPLPPTEDVLSELLAEQRKTNDLLTQLLARPTLTLHGQERDWQAQDAYSGSLACRVASKHGTPATDPYRPNRGPQAEM